MTLIEEKFRQVKLKYILYNSLFLNLPFKGIYRTGTWLPIFEQICRETYQKGEDPIDAVERFFADYLPQIPEKDQDDLFFQFIQYIERQVVLFDSVEDASFEQINDVSGRGSFNELKSRVRTAGKDAQLLEELNKCRIRVVLTAHPTQFYPGPVLAILTDLEKAIRDSNLPHIDLLLQQLGKTPFLNKKKPTPLDEAVNLIWYLENVFYTAVSGLVAELLDKTGVDPISWSNPELIRIGFWPGGDRDGNPFVTPEITLDVSRKLRDVSFKCYYRDIRILRRRLTFRGVDELMLLIEQKIYNGVYGDPQHSYIAADELLSDLGKARAILVNDHDGLFLDLMDRLILKVRIFGFFMATLDIRQESGRHGKIWAEILKEAHAEGKSVSSETYASWSEDEQIKYLLEFKEDISQYCKDSEMVREQFEIIKGIRQIQTHNGQDGCHRYIISNAGTAIQVIEVYALLKGFFPKESPLPMDIVPLFESISDLGEAPAVMAKLYEIPEYRAHLAQREGKQTIMLGFSDGTKDGGYLKANWGIFVAKEALTKTSRAYDVMVVFFDGRGGPPARGGGNTHDYYAAQGNEIESTEIQLTVQGQTISANFGKPVSCKYNLEQLLSASLENKLFESRQQKWSAEERALMDELAEESYQSYLALKNHDQFVDYLAIATPLQWFGETNIGSRPVKRNAGEALSFKDLRAIPFVGSWAQMKQNVPGYYGVGEAFEKWKKEGKLEDVKRLYKDSLFFRALLGNSMQSLAKSFFPVTAYLAKDETFADFWHILKNEYERSCEMILEVAGQKILLEDNPLSRESIRLRERIVLPLITIQQYALQRIRNGNLSNERAETMKRLIMRCMFGIINAARNAA
jgi:phosphoenolpyruvate carboxylase